MIVVQLRGGLGNQMFQYALGRRLSLDHGVPLKLDIRPLESDPQRRYVLDHFRIAATLVRPSEFAWRLPRPLQMPRRLAWVPRWPGTMRYVHEGCGDPFDPRVLDTPRSAFLVGYWPSEKYFACVAEAIRAEFQLVTPMTGARTEVGEAIQAVDAVSLHVRRGDYVSNPVANAYHGTCSIEWYERAMMKIAETVGDPTFFVFSDDPEWSRRHLPSRWPMRFVEPQSDGRDWEDMHLMAMCRHHIIANSSFSWWGAWLNPSSDKRVIAPQRWLANTARDTSDFVPDAWERL